MKVAVVAPGFADGWNEAEFVARRVAAGLATWADVDLVVTGGSRRASETWLGRIRVTRLPVAGRSAGADGTPLPRLVAAAEWAGLRGTSLLRWAAAALVDDLPEAVEDELLRGCGTEAAELPGWFRGRGTEWDLVVFIDAAAPSTVFGLRALDGGPPTIVVPLAREDPLLRLRACRRVLERTGGLLHLSEHEAGLLAALGGAAVAGKSDLLPLELRVPDLVRQTPPPDLPDGPYVVVARDWAAEPEADRIIAWAERLANDLAGIEVRLIGRNFPDRGLGTGVDFVAVGSRTDTWRWMSRAAAVWAPELGRPLGREVAEAMLLGVPTLVPAEAGATREYVEQGDGGLWYANYPELLGCAERLLDATTRDRLGEQAAEYAERRFMGTEEAFLEVLRRAAERAIRAA